MFIYQKFLQMLLHIISYFLVLSVICLKLSHAKAFLVIEETEREEARHQYSYEESYESKLSYDYQDIICESPVYVGDTSCEEVR